MSNYNRFTIERKLKEFIEEDCNFTDVSSSVIPEKAESIAKIIAKSEGYISGLEELKMLFGILHVSLDLNKVDGQQFKEGDVIAELQGKTRDILLGERVGLNIITHMSAITSTTKKFVEIIANSGRNVKIACTR
ncbi:MAG: nicotinate-nucleotide diphosphorylase, partial [Promethearchaeota archaeon]